MFECFIIIHEVCTKNTTRYCNWLVYTCLGLCQKVRRIVTMLQCSLKHYVDNMQIMIYVITKRLFLVISMYSNDSKVTSSFISMDVSRLGSNIIQK